MANLILLNENKKELQKSEIFKSFSLLELLITKWLKISKRSRWLNMVMLSFIIHCDHSIKMNIPSIPYCNSLGQACWYTNTVQAIFIILTLMQFLKREIFSFTNNDLGKKRDKLMNIKGIRFFDLFRKSFREQDNIMLVKAH